MSNEDNKLWFEQVSSLSRGLRLMEKLPNEQKELVAKETLSLVKTLKLTRDVEDIDANELGYERVKETMKLKSSDAWFAQNSTMVKALGELHGLGEPLQHEVGLKLLVCLQALDQYNQGDEGSDWDNRLGLSQVIKSVFEKEIEVFTEQGEQKKKQRVEQELAIREEEAETLRLLEEEWARIEAENQPLVVINLQQAPPFKGSEPTEWKLTFTEGDLKITGAF